MHKDKVFHGSVFVSLFHHNENIDTNTEVNRGTKIKVTNLKLIEEKVGQKVERWFEHFLSNLD